MMKITLQLFLCAVISIAPGIVIPASAWGGNGNGNGNGSNAIIRSDLLGLSGDQIKQAKELVAMLMQQDDTTLIIYKNSKDVCKYLECSNLDPGLISSLSDSILRHREQDRRIFWTVIAVGIALCSLVISLLTYIKKTT